MFETIQKYSEQAYYSKADLEKELDSYLVEPLWHEICQYRSYFQKEFCIHEKKTFLVYTPSVVDAMAKTQEWIHRYVKQHLHEPLQELDCFWLKEEEVWIFQSFLTQLETASSYTHAFMMQHIIEQMHLEKQLSLASRKRLLDEQENLLHQLFLLSIEQDKRCAFILMYPILKCHEALCLGKIFKMEEFCDLYDKKDVDMDVTGRFLSFLAYIRLKISNDMVLLKADAQKNVTDMQYQELVECYPMLCKEQIRFFIEHRTHHHYYTLQDYMRFSDVCYETARYSMEKLVELHWYQKQKMGKKFVYYIM